MLIVISSTRDQFGYATALVLYMLAVLYEIWFKVPLGANETFCTCLVGLHHELLLSISRIIRESVAVYLDPMKAWFGIIGKILQLIELIDNLVMEFDIVSHSPSFEVAVQDGTKVKDTDSVDGSMTDGMEHIFTSSTQLRCSRDLNLNEDLQ
ncbi:hypothetical protein VNO77_03439 [Canavalia gladiata]|uniref:Uncharacterized protein n=1 Tax=Canavalia gladiata TaxID=3824 RepID=A0AAN9RC87_CANGL